MVLCSETFDVYVWRKSNESDQLEPTWKFSDNFSDPLSPISDFTMATDSFACSQSGELLLCRVKNSFFIADISKSLIEKR